MEKKKIMITGEGPTDYGREAGGIWRWGPVGIYVKKCLKESDMLESVELVEAKRTEIDHLKLQKRSLQGIKGKAIPARKFFVYAKRHDMDYGIYYCDADKGDGRGNKSEIACKRNFDKVYAEVREGLNDKKFIPMIAEKMIECWILGDSDAIKAQTKKKNINVEITEKPELLWGSEHNPDSDYPKCYLKRILKEISLKGREIPANMDSYCGIAEKSDIEKLKENCPISFNRFYKDFEELKKMMANEIQANEELHS